MAKKDLMEFYEFLRKDENLRKRFRLIVQVLNKENISSREIEDVKQNIVWLGREYGFYFTEDEFIDSLRELQVVAYSSKIIPMEKADTGNVAGGSGDFGVGGPLNTLKSAGVHSINMNHLINGQNIF